MVFIVGCFAADAGKSLAQCVTHESVPSDAAAGDNFGFSVSMSGNLCAVGARFDDAGTVNSGSAYIYRFDPLQGKWVQEAKLTAPDPGINDEFGYSVAVHCDAVSGDVAVIGARHDDDEGMDSGSAYFFKSDGSAWNLICKVTASDGATADRFGFAVAIAGPYALISARDDDAPNTNSGSVYAFHFNGTTWTQYAKLVPADVSGNDQFGHALAMALKSDGTGAYGIVGSWHDDAPMTNSGSAYVYGFNAQSGAWSQQTKLNPPDPASNDEFGFSVAICSSQTGDYAVVGARNNDDGGNDAGSAYVFQRVGTTWAQHTKLLAQDAAADDQFGQSVAIAANAAGIIVGANSEDQAGSNAGAAYVFWQQAKDQSWSEASKLVMNSGLAGDLFGTSVAAGIDRGVVGGYLNDSVGTDAGLVSFYAGVSGADFNGNGLVDGCDTPGDVNGDGLVDILDLSILISLWGVCPGFPQPCVADIDANGSVDVTDLIIAINNWSSTPAN